MVQPVCYEIQWRICYGGTSFPPQTTSPKSSPSPMDSRGQGQDLKERVSNLVHETVENVQNAAPTPEVSAQAYHHDGRNDLVEKYAVFRGSVRPEDHRQAPKK
jgi:hypothetical protein